MGGRGSGGGRSSGGGKSSSNPPKLVNANQYFKEHYSKMTDAELNRAYVNAKNQMKKEQVKVAFEKNKLSKMVDEFKAMSNDDPRLNKKWDAIEKQTSRLNDASSKAEIRSQAYLWAVNERYNIRGKYNPNDLKGMTNGQLNSYYHKMYNMSLKCARTIKKTNSAKTRSKYEKIFNECNNNFEKANSERKKRGLGLGKDAKNW